MSRLLQILANVVGYSLAATYLSLALTVFLFLLSTRFSVAGYFARLIASYYCLVVCAIYGATASIVLRIVGYEGVSQWATARSFKWLMWYAVGVQFVIEDPYDYLNSTRPAVFIGNHQTELDVLMLAYIFPQYCSVTAKSSLKAMPFLGWFMMLSGTVFIDRQDRSSAREAMTGAAEQMQRRKQSVYMFPEGTRSYYKEPGLLPFKKGAFHLAVQAKVPIVPVVVANYSDILSVRNWRFRSGRILIKVLRPIETAKLSSDDVENLTRDVREQMLTEHLALTVRQRVATSTPLPVQLAAKNQAKPVKATGVSVS